MYVECGENFCGCLLGMEFFGRYGEYENLDLKIGSIFKLLN